MISNISTLSAVIITITTTITIKMTNLDIYTILNFCLRINDMWERCWRGHVRKILVLLQLIWISKTSDSASKYLYSSQRSRSRRQWDMINHRTGALLNSVLWTGVNVVIFLTFGPHLNSFCSAIYLFWVTMQHLLLLCRATLTYSPILALLMYILNKRHFLTLSLFTFFAITFRACHLTANLYPTACMHIYLTAKNQFEPDHHFRLVCFPAAFFRRLGMVVF